MFVLVIVCSGIVEVIAYVPQVSGVIFLVFTIDFQDGVLELLYIGMVTFTSHTSTTVIVFTVIVFMVGDITYVSCVFCECFPINLCPCR